MMGRAILAVLLLAIVAPPAATAQPFHRPPYVPFHGLDRSPPAFVQISIAYQRISDGQQTGSEVIAPASGLSRSIPNFDRRIVLTATAGDPQSGLRALKFNPNDTITCRPGVAPLQPLFGYNSDEEAAGMLVPGHPPARTAHFTYMPTIGCTDDIQFTVTAENGVGLTTSSAIIDIKFLGCPQLASPFSGDGSDVISVAVGRDGVTATSQVALLLTVPPAITEWKAVNLSGVEVATANGLLSSATSVPLSQVIGSPQLTFKKARRPFGIHDTVQTVSLPAPASLGGCRISVTWTKDH